MQRSKQFNSVSDIVFLNHFLEHNLLWAVSADYEVHVVVFLKNHWDDVYEQINAFAEGEAADHYDVYHVHGITETWVRCKLQCVYRVWDNVNFARVYRRSQC